MAAYTTEEIQAAVERLVRSSIRRPYDILGTRRTDLTFNDVQEAAAGVFILYANAPFYVVSLGARRLLESISAEGELLDEIRDCISATDRKVLPVEDVSPLFNARAALQELASAASARAQGFKDITTVPAFQRFDQNVNTFLDGPGKNIKQNGEIVRTPQEARTLLPSLLSQLKAAHEELIDKATKLAESIENYNSVNLPSLAAQGVISRASTLIGSDAELLNAMSKEERLEAIRGVVLNLLAAKAVVTTFGSFTPPGEFFSVNGSGFAFSDAQHPANPAVLEADLGGAASIVAGVNDELVLVVNGAAPITLKLSPSNTGYFEGTGQEVEYGGYKGFLIGNGTSPEPETNYPQTDNNELYVKVGASDLVLTAPVSGNPTMASVEGNVNLVALAYPGDVQGQSIQVNVNGTTNSYSIASNPATVVAFLNELNTFLDDFGILARMDGGSGHIIIEHKTAYTTAVGYNASKFELVGGTLLPVVGVVAGVYRGTTPLTTLEAICTAFNTTLNPVGATAEPYFSPLKYGGSMDNPGGVDPVLTLPIPGSANFTALDVAVGDLVHIMSGPDAGYWPVLAVTATTLQIQGTFTGGSGQVLEAGPKLRKLRIKLTNPGTQVAAETELGFIRTTSDKRKNALLTYGLIATTDLVTPPAFKTGARKSYVTDIANDIGRQTTLLTVSTTAKAVTGQPQNADCTSKAFDAFVVVFPAALAPQKYDIVRIHTGPNQGDYLVDGAGANPGEVKLQRAIQVSEGADSQPVTFKASYLREYLVLTSKNTTTVSAISASGSAASLFYSSVPKSVVGTSNWFKLPSVPRALQAGDILELFAAQYNSPSEQLDITTVDAGLGVIGIEPATKCGITWTFGDTALVPYARLRIGKKYDFNTFKTRLVAWLALSQQQASYFIELNRRINPLLVNDNPTAEQVGTALSQLESLWVKLQIAEALAKSQDPALSVEDIIKDYGDSVEAIPAVDALLKTFKEKGSDRATDLLLGGEFSEFFSIDQDGASYAGAFQNAMREVAREDLPVRKTGRLETVQSRIRGSSESTDFEYNADNVDEQVAVDPPDGTIL